VGASDSRRCAKGAQRRSVEDVSLATSVCLVVRVGDLRTKIAIDAGTIRYDLRPVHQKRAPPRDFDRRFS